MRRIASKGTVVAGVLYPSSYEDERQPKASLPLSNLAPGAWPDQQDPVSVLLQLQQECRERASHRNAPDSKAPTDIPSEPSRGPFAQRESETLFTPFGEVETQRFDLRSAGLVADVWLAETYDCAPIRLRLRSDQGFALDMAAAKKPSEAR